MIIQSVKNKNDQVRGTENNNEILIIKYKNKKRYLYDFKL